MFLVVEEIPGSFGDGERQTSDHDSLLPRSPGSATISKATHFDLLSSPENVFVGFSLSGVLELCPLFLRIFGTIAEKLGCLIMSVVVFFLRCGSGGVPLRFSYVWSSFPFAGKFSRVSSSTHHRNWVSVAASSVPYCWGFSRSVACAFRKEMKMLSYSGLSFVLHLLVSSSSDFGAPLRRLILSFS